MAKPSSRVNCARGRRRKKWGAGAALAVMATLLVACSSSSATPVLTWYINPDTGGQDKVAENCSTKDYTIQTQILPTDATQQRIQLARRLAAEDSSIDIMSIDPPYTAELANAGYLAPIPQDFASKLKQQSFKAATTAATWEGKLVVAPFWSNTQVLWYRKSFAKKAGIDMSKPVTWDQIIKAASDNGGTVAVQANRYEGYLVWINALITGAGGQVVKNADKGADATIALDSPAGEDAAKTIEELARSKAAPPDLSVSTEGTATATFAADSGAFMVNWTYVYHNYDESDPGVAKDLGFARYPETVPGKSSRPPYGGIGVGVSKYSKHVDQAMKAVECITSPKNQAVNANITGNMPASPAGYDDPDIKKTYPPEVIKLFEDSLNTAGTRAATPYYGDLAGGMLKMWHPPSGVNSSTPQKSATFIENVLQGEALL
jgi:multiple sugar transport system substrate-binding protein